MQAKNVFTPAKMPTVTYVDDHLSERTETLLNALDAGGLVISLSGPSKSGKTVFIEKTLGKDKLIQVTGAGVDSPEKLWDRVFDLMGIPKSREVADQNGYQVGATGKIAAEAGVIVQGKVEAEASGNWTEGHTTKKEYAVDYLQLLIKELGDGAFVLFIDDFHYIAGDAQREIAKQIKDAAQKGVKIVCAAVPYHSDDAIRANTDLRGRIAKIDFDYWTPDELKKIATSGFAALNLSPTDAYVDGIVSEAAGSPQLMQALCLNTCYKFSKKQSCKNLEHLNTTMETIESVCTQTALLTDYSSTVEKLKDGPKTRGQERKAYLLTDGNILDVYPLVLRAIAVNPPELTIRYANLLGRIGTLCEKDPPSGSSVTGACSHISAIANEAENGNVIEWDGANDVLDIRDPYLLFYLRWGD